MNQTLIITLLASDRPGVVHALTELLAEHGANWDDSRMATLGDKFAGLVKVSVDGAKSDALIVALRAMDVADNQIQLQVEASGIADEPMGTLSLSLMGQDRPGIVGDISKVLDGLGVNILALESERREASMSGEILFNAELELGIPAGVDDDAVCEALEAMSDQFMVDLAFSGTASA